MRVLAPLAFLALVACKSGDGAPPLQVLAFKDVAPGIAYTALDVEGDNAFTGHAFTVDLTKADVHVVPAGPAHRPVDIIAASRGAHVATNASFFDEEAKPMGRVVDAGNVLVSERRAQWGALVIDKGQARVVKGDTLPQDASAPGGGGGDLVVQGLPRLVVAGEVPKLKPASAERTAVCADGSKLTLVVATKPVDTTAFARFLAKPRDKGGLGCKDALNLDGGPSTQLHANLAGLALDVKGGWGVPNALVVTPR